MRRRNPWSRPLRLGYPLVGRMLCLRPRGVHVELEGGLIRSSINCVGSALTLNIPFHQNS